MSAVGCTVVGQVGETQQGTGRGGGVSRGAGHIDTLGLRHAALPSPPPRLWMEVVAVRSSQGLVFLWTEWSPPNEAAALAAFDAALPAVEIG